MWSRLISTFLLFPMFFHSLFEDDMINQLTSFSTRLFTISTKGQSIVVNKGWLSPNLIFFNRKEGNYNWRFWFYSYLNSHLVAYLSWNYSYFFYLFPYFVMVSSERFHFRMPVLLIWETVAQVSIPFGAWISKWFKCSVALY